MSENETFHLFWHIHTSNTSVKKLTICFNNLKIKTVNALELVQID